MRFAVGEAAGEGFSLDSHAARIDELWAEKEHTRIAALGYMIQPVADVAVG